MAYRYSSSAPSGFLIDDTGHFVKVDDATYNSYKSGQATAQPTQQPTQQQPTQPQQQGGSVTLYFQNANGTVSTNTVPAGDASYWQGQGWTTSRPSTQQRQQSQTKSTDSQINSLYQQHVGRNATPEELANWRNSTTAELDTFLKQDVEKWNTGTQTNTFSDIITKTYDEMEKTGDLAGMSDEQKQLAVVQQAGLTATTEEDKALAQQYLAKAKELADPYYKSMVNVALDELQRTTATSEADLEYKQKSLDDKISRLQSDLSYNRDKLTLDEQAEMATQLAEYQQAKESNDLAMQEAGLTFSSPRKLAEQRLATAQDTTAQSTARKYATARREQELTVQREAENIAREKELNERQATETKTAADRLTESKVGSSVMPSGATTLGGVTGSIEDERKSAILELSDIIAKRKGEIPTY
ncbi:MAG: hypothetical protein M0R06_01945 [Sphaerochaeta sp.]|jgi:hypothetical protein|nr:hypothetical protein [Sphaerochaeta sp.]